MAPAYTSDDADEMVRKIAAAIEQHSSDSVTIRTWRT
jgi:hypothetical protein